MSKFKIGDRVRDGIGDEGIITGVHKEADNSFSILWETGNFKGDILWDFEKNLELVNTTPWYLTEEGQPGVELMYNASKYKELSKTYRVGQQFDIFDEYFCDSQVYVLAQVEAHKCALIGLQSGNRFIDPVWVSNVNAITEDEFKEITGIIGSDYTITAL